MIGLGIPASRINSVGPDDLIGIKVYFALVKSGEFTNVKKVSVRQDIVPTFGMTTF
jgi:hypothetical protein